MQSSTATVFPSLTAVTNQVTQASGVNLPGNTVSASIFSAFQEPSAEIGAQVKHATTGNAISRYMEHFVIGYFDIDCDLLMAHPDQREVDTDLVEKLVNSFSTRNLHQTQETAGLLLASGPEWNHLFHHSPEPIHITSQFSNFEALQGEEGKIGQIICGQHRWIALNEWAEKAEKPDQAFWRFKVLSPCMNQFFLELDYLFISENLFSISNGPSSDSH
jgi:hypothetical protein